MIFSNIHAYRYQLRCSVIGSKAIPAIHPLLLEPEIKIFI